MINNTSHSLWDRLQQKTLNQQFTNRLIDGLNCSPFEELQKHFDIICEKIGVNAVLPHKKFLKKRNPNSTITAMEPGIYQPNSVNT